MNKQNILTGSVSLIVGIALTAVTLKAPVKNTIVKVISQGASKPLPSLPSPVLNQIQLANGQTDETLQIPVYQTLDQNELQFRLDLINKQIANECNATSTLETEKTTITDELNQFN